MHHAALGVELPEHRVRQPVALHPEPQLQLVGGHVDEVNGEVVARAGVHARAALGRVDAAEILLDEQVALPGEQRLELVEQLLMARAAHGRVGGVIDLAELIPAIQLDLGSLDLRPQRVELLDDLQILLDVPRPDRLRPLEHHVLEEMRDAGDAGPLVHGADLGHPAGRHVRVAGPGNQQQGQAVVEPMLDHVDLLGAGGPRQRQEDRKNPPGNLSHRMPRHVRTEESGAGRLRPRGQL